MKETTMTEDLYMQLTEALRRRQLVAVATVLAGPGLGNKMLLWPNGQRVGTLGKAQLDAQVIERAQSAFQSLKSERFPVSLAQEHSAAAENSTAESGEETVDLFLEIYAPPAKLLIIGAVHIAIPLVTFANALGFETQVLDARSAFATEERFHHADHLAIGWPADTLTEMPLDEATYLVFLTHDEKIDNPALAVALHSNARYIGALGSRKTHAKRVDALLEMGVPEEAINRIHAPIGLNIGARRPEEIAVAIMGQIVQVMNQ
ncbi:MAG: XdhC family protein, partial [Caldilineaceae bacterium]|nr:XdhC family protein [Caldilineaceae bacterium]